MTKPKALPKSTGTSAGASAWPALSATTWEIGRLKVYSRNARKHSPQQIEQLRQSLREFGWTMPILAREDGTVIAGHGRLAAALADGRTQVPVILATGWTEEQCRAYGLADNKLGEGSDWDQGLLAAELAELGDLGVDLAPFGFESKGGAGDSSVDASPQLEGLTYSIVVRCTDEAQQGELLEKLEKEGLTCEALIS